MHPQSKAWRLISTLTLLAPPLALADGPYLTASASATWQDNATNAPSGDGIRSAFTVDSGATATWLKSAGFSTLILSSLSANVEVCTTFAGLDNIALGPLFEVRHKLAVGPHAPTVYAGLNGQCVGFSDPERSRVEGAFVFGYGQRLSDAVQVLVDGRLGSFNANDIVFSGNYASLTTTLNWDVNETWRLKVTGGWRDGDAVANYTAVNSPYGWLPVDQGAFDLPGAWHYVATFHEPFVAWRVSARTWSYGAGISPAIGKHTSVTLQFSHFDTSGLDRYLDNVVSLSLAHKY